MLPPAVARVEDDRETLTADVAIAAQQLPEDEREAYLAEVARIERLARNPFGSMKQKLALPERPGYHRHWFNDSPGRVDEANENGWSHVKDKQGKKVRRVVGSAKEGGPLFAYAMEIPKIFFNRDMDARHAVASARMEEIRKNPIRAPAGAAQRSDRGKFYSPKEEALSVRETAVIEKRSA